MKVIVAGGREFKDQALMFSKLRLLFGMDRTDPDRAHLVPEKFIIGGARGADTLAEDLFKAGKFPYEVCKAEWGNHGKVAGIIRNLEMAAKADCLVAFWDGRSRGTRHMIQAALDQDLEVHVFRYYLEE